MNQGGGDLQSPFRPEGFDFSHQTRLTGARCQDCGEAFFPPRTCCLRCGSTHLEPLALGDRGTIHSYTVIHRAPKGFDPPYACGWVELPERVLVWSLFKVPPTSLRVGLDVHLVFEKVGDRTVYLFEEAR